MKVSSIRWGIIWIGIGLFFLAINFRVLDNLVFPALFSLWPILLIAIGVELIFRRTRFYFLALLSPLLIAAAFIFAAVYAGGYSWSFEEFWKDWSWTYEGEKKFSEEITFDSDIDTLRLIMDLGTAEFEIGPSTNRVFSVKTNFYKKSPIITYKNENTVAFIEYRNRESGNLSIFSIKKRQMFNDFQIYDGAPLYADIRTKLKYPILDFSIFNLEELTLSLKSKESRIRFGDNNDNARIEINGRSERLILEIPEEFGLELLMDDFDMDRLNKIAGLYRFPDGYRTGDFQNADRRATVVLDMSTKKIDIRRI
jgi:hypothetical protein